MNTCLPVIDPIGTIFGRDAIYLDKVEFLRRTVELVLCGQLNSSLCSGAVAGSAKFIPYEIKFSGVVATRHVTLELWNGPSSSSLDEVLDSTWIAELQAGLGADQVFYSNRKVRHYCVQTYDDVFEVVCDEMFFEVGK